MPRKIVNRQRAKHTRTKLGCGVCRIRRVRCDRSRPACEKCTSTGRTCDGYPQDPQPPAGGDQSQPGTGPALPLVSSSARPMARNHISASPFSPDEMPAFEFFRLKTSVELCGDFGDTFWSRLVPQVSQREQSVKHLILALSSLHQAVGNTPVNTAPDLAVQHYSKALRALNHHIISNQGASLHITLLSTIMCITFEWLRENYSAALVHLRSAMKLLHEWHQASLSGIPGLAPRTSFWSPSGHLIRSTLLPIYIRLFIQTQSILRDHQIVLPPIDPSTALGDRPFENVDEARDNLYELLTEAYNYRTYYSKRKHKRKADPDDKPRLRVEEALSLWCDRLDEFFIAHPETQLTSAALSLQIWRDTMGIMVSLKDSCDEMEFDLHTATFARIVESAAELYSRRMTCFTADISVVAVLYYVGVKCRHPLIRRQALALLMRAPRREGIWDAAKAAQVVQHLLDMEEGMGQRVVVSESDIKREERMRGFSVIMSDEGGQWTLDPEDVF